MPAVAARGACAAMVERARAAQPGVGGARLRGPRRRSCAARRSGCVDNAERIVETIVAETGKTYEDALLAEVAYAANAFGFWAKHAPGVPRPTRRSARANPFVLGRKLVVRYRAGRRRRRDRAVELPADELLRRLHPGAGGRQRGRSSSRPRSTPLTSLLIAEGMRECGLPEGVFQVATGRGETGAALVDEVDMVMFTGSTRDRQARSWSAPRETLTPVSLELGGKDPMIVLADADLERAANAAVYYSMQNGGQTCISVERVYVEAPVYDEFVAQGHREGRARCARACPTGPGTVDVGAITFPPQLDIVAATSSRRATAGAQRAGRRPRAATATGRFYEPTVLVDVDHSMAAMTEETFGPTLPIMKVADADEAIRLANDSPYGLAASVWTKDVARGEEIARRVEAGAVCVNDAQLNYLALELPMGGWKDVRARRAPRRARASASTARQQSLLVTRLAPKRDLHMFPYKARHDRAAGEGHASCSTGAASATSAAARGRARPQLVAVLGARRLLRRPPEPAARALLAVLLVSQGVALALLIPFALAVGDETPSAARGRLGGARRARPASIALGAFYRALAIGTMSVVAPISATARGGAGARRPGRGRAARARCRSPAWRSRWPA